MKSLRQRPLPIYKGKVKEGQRVLADQIELLLKTEDSNLFNLVKVNSKVFLEPLLFTYFGSSDKARMSLAQILWGYISEENKPIEIEAYANNAGIVELPNYGYLLTGQNSTNLRLLWQVNQRTCILQTNNNELVGFKFRPYVIIPGTSLSVCTCKSSLLESLFVDEAGQLVSCNIEIVSDRRLKQLENALSAIRKYLPDYYMLIELTTRYVYLYSGEAPYSFATVAAHGIAFINIEEASNEIYLMEDIIHQCGHIIFSALTTKLSFFKVPQNLPLKLLTGNDAENRTIFVALHGVYTEAWMNCFWDIFYDQSSFKKEQYAELLGRFTLILLRFGIDLSTLCYTGIFNKEGEKLKDAIYQLYIQLMLRHKGNLSQYDVSNQPYCFDKEKFFQTNNKLLVSQGLLS